jgi:hypothetical protein
LLSDDVVAQTRLLAEHHAFVLQPGVYSLSRRVLLVLVLLGRTSRLGFRIILSFGIF